MFHRPNHAATLVFARSERDAITTPLSGGFALTNGSIVNNIFRPALRALLVAGGLWLLATILLGTVYPSLIQRYAVEPNELSPRLLELIAGSGGRICRHLHIPLQSGDDEILKKMNRQYAREDYLKLIETGKRIPSKEIQEGLAKILKINI